MKKYVKPAFDVTVFEVNNYCSNCELVDGSDFDATQDQVIVHCLKTNQHAIFFEKCSTNYNSISHFTYDGQAYISWSGSSSGDIACDRGCNSCNQGEDLFEDLVDASLISNRDHCAPVTPEMQKVLNHS